MFDGVDHTRAISLAQPPEGEVAWDMPRSNCPHRQQFQNPDANCFAVACTIKGQFKKNGGKIGDFSLKLKCLPKV
jgi:hypothetical protein